MNGAVALIIAFTAVFALCRRTELYQALTDGIRDGLKVVYKIFSAGCGHAHGCIHVQGLGRP